MVNFKEIKQNVVKSEIRRYSSCAFLVVKTNNLNFASILAELVSANFQRVFNELEGDSLINIRELQRLKRLYNVVAMKEQVLIKTPSVKEARFLQLQLQLS